MNRRNFFGAMGAMLAGAVLGRNLPVESDPFHASVFVKGFESSGGGTLTFGRLDGWQLIAGENLSVPGERFYIDPDAEVIYLDSKDARVGLWQPMSASDVTIAMTPVDFDWYGAWL